MFAYYLDLAVRSLKRNKLLTMLPMPATRSVRCFRTLSPEAFGGEGRVRERELREPE
jgi:hypothetical protein